MSTALVVREEQPEALILSPVMNIEVAKRRLAEFQGFIKEYLVENEDFGTIPGTPKPTLLKPGADKLCELYGLADDYVILKEVESFTADPPLFDYTILCRLTSRRDGRLVATGLGSCNSYEGKYKWREGQRLCPKCGKPAIVKGKQEFGGGWLCFAKKQGCGAKFTDGDKSIEGQTVGRVLNDDLATQKNTILKMAKKRAKIDATLGATRSSGIFTQDLEDVNTAIDVQPEIKQQPKENLNGQKKSPTKAAKKTETKLEGPPQAKIPVVVIDVKEFKTSKNSPALDVLIDTGAHLYCFHNYSFGESGEKVFDVLKSSKDKKAIFTTKSGKTANGKPYIDIIGVLQIGDREWLEDGTPVIRREAVTSPVIDQGGDRFSDALREPGDEDIPY